MQYAIGMHDPDDPEKIIAYFTDDPKEVWGAFEKAALISDHAEASERADEMSEFWIAMNAPVRATVVLVPRMGRKH